MEATSATRLSRDSTAETWAATMDYIVGRKRAEEALGFLAACSRELADTLAYETAMSRVASYAVPFLAGWCTFDLLESGDGPTQTIAEQRISQLSSEQTKRMREFLHQPDGPTAHGMAWVTSTRRPLAYSDAKGLADACNQATLAAAQRVGIRSALVVPLLARDQLLGFITLVRTGAHKQQRFGPADVALVDELARRVASAVELERLHCTIEELQTSR